MSDLPPARIKPPEVARLTGLSTRNIQAMALRGEIPGAAKLGHTWTFDPAKLRGWIIKKEAELCRAKITSISEVRHIGAASRLPDVSIAAAYEQIMRGKPARG